MMYGDFAYFYDKLMYDLDYEKIYKRGSREKVTRA